VHGVVTFPSFRAFLWTYGGLYLSAPSRTFRPFSWFFFAPPNSLARDVFLVRQISSFPFFLLFLFGHGFPSFLLFWPSGHVSFPVNCFFLFILFLGLCERSFDKERSFALLGNRKFLSLFSPPKPWSGRPSPFRPISLISLATISLHVPGFCCAF